MKQENKHIKTFYDTFSNHLNVSGYNFRHYQIAKWLDKLGNLNSSSNVLEIGCGPGHSTLNFVNRIKEGKIVAVDISEENIEFAKKLHSNVNNIEFHVTDMSDFSHDLKFDLVLLPDVLEHIPIDQHNDLFKTIRRHLKDLGVVLIHIPDPEYLEFKIETSKETLQVIDQPIHTDIIAKNLRDSGLRITFLQSYNLSSMDYDYQVIRLEPNDLELRDNPKPWDRSIKSRVRRRINSLLGKRSFE
ncbi:class I SAM-dependent methyltransferase [Halocola ammonii]